MNPTELKKWRKQHGLSQGALAQLAGVSTMIIAKFESGNVTPQKKTASKIINGVKSVENNPSTSASIHVTNLDLELMRQVLAMSEKEKTGLLRKINV